MISAPYYSQLLCSMKRILPLVLVLAAAITTRAAPKPSITSPLTATGQVGVAFSYTITATHSPTSYNAIGLPSGLTVNPATGEVSGTPAVGTDAGSPYNVTISATNSGGTGSATLVLTINPAPTAGNPWIYTNPSGTTAANTIMTLDQVATAGREPDFFELLQAAILTGSLGQDTGGGGTRGVTGPKNIGGTDVFPDIHMSSTTQHILSIGASIIDQADPDSIPMRIQFIGTNGNSWAAYGVENLPYITQLYPIAGTSPDNPTKWATYLLFQLWSPNQNAVASAPLVRLRVDGGIGLFAGGNNETWNTSSTEFINATGQSVIVSPSLFSTATPLTTSNAPGTGTAPGTFATLTAFAVPTPTPAP
jgi:hypothetical protein